MDNVSENRLTQIENMEELPVVSVVIPVFNSEKYVEATIDSIVASTYINIEIIIVDDGSIDGSADICTRKAKGDARIKVIQMDNSGPSHARNTGITFANGKYILPVDSDDLIHETYIEKAVNIMENNSNMGIVYCKGKLFDAMNCEWDLLEYSLTNMLLSNCIFATALFRREDWVAVGGYSEDMRWGIEDYDFWLSIISLGRDVYRIPEILFYYRKHPGSRTEVFEKNIDRYILMYRHIIEHHIELFDKVFFSLQGKRIALYGAGRAGIVYYIYQTIKGVNDVVCWVDQNYEKIERQCNREICSPMKLGNYNVDAIVVAINDDIEAMNIIEKLNTIYNIPTYRHFKRL